MPEYWQAMGTVFTGKGMGDVNGVRFGDINGDVSRRLEFKSLGCGLEPS